MKRREFITGAVALSAMSVPTMSVAEVNKYPYIGERFIQDTFLNQLKQDIFDSTQLESGEVSDPDREKCRIINSIQEDLWRLREGVG